MSVVQDNVFSRTTQNRQNLDVNLLRTERLRANDARVMQLMVGTDGTPQTITAGPTATANLRELTTIIDLGGGVCVISLPIPTNMNTGVDQFQGLTKAFIMQSVGTATIVPQGASGVSTTLLVQDDTVEYQWIGTRWVLFGGTAIVQYGVLGPVNGGTGLSSYMPGDTLYANAINTLTTLPIGSNGQVLTVAAGFPSWQNVAAGGIASVSGTANRITSSGGANPVIDISAAYVGQSSITTLGTITTGVWNATTIAIANGGTGQTTATAAFDALSPTTTLGDLIYNNGVHNVRLPLGSANQVLTVSGGTVNWVTGVAGTVTSVSGTANRITSTGGTTPVIDISAAYVGQSSITTLGTVTTGTWNATTIAIANGGTGQTTKAAAFNALSPITTTGDMIYSIAGTSNVRLPIGSVGQILTVSAGSPTWQTFTGAQSGTYTPTVTNGANVASSTPALCGYHVVNNTSVTVYGSVSITVTTAGTTPTNWQLSLPFSSISAGAPFSGTGAEADANSQSTGTIAVVITADFVTSTANFWAVGVAGTPFPASGSTAVVTFHYSYFV